MKAYLSPVQSALVIAFSRLQTWFDPAQTGSPYELPQRNNGVNRKKRYPLFTKKLRLGIWMDSGKRRIL